MADEKSLEKSGHQDGVDEVRKQSIVESINLHRNVDAKCVSADLDAIEDY